MTRNFQIKIKSRSIHTWCDYDKSYDKFLYKYYEKFGKKKKTTCTIVNTSLSIAKSSTYYVNLLTTITQKKKLLYIEIFNAAENITNLKS